MDKKTLPRRQFLKASLAISAFLAIPTRLLAARALKDAKGTPIWPEADQIVKSACRSCYGRCGLLGHVHNGRLVKIEGNPEIPNNQGTNCLRSMAIPQLMYSPHRLKYPLMRVGKRGEGKWRRISWDEAMGTCARRFKEIKEKYGANTIIYQHGTGRDNFMISALQQLWWQYGTGMNFATGNLCWVGSYFVSNRIYGDECQYTGWDARRTKCILMMSRSMLSRGYYDWVETKKALKRGAKLIVLDPRFSTMASKADLWLPIRPTSDLAFVLFMTNSVIRKRQFDEKFVKKWTAGTFLVKPDGWFLRESDLTQGGSDKRFAVWDENSSSHQFWDADALEWSAPDVEPALFGAYRVNGAEYKPAFQLLADGVAEYTAEKTAGITELPVDKLELAAKWWGEAIPHACFARGQKVEFSHNVSGISQALTNLMAISGTFDVEGGQNIARDHSEVRDNNDIFRVAKKSQDQIDMWRNVDRLSPNPGQYRILGAMGVHSSTTRAMIDGDPIQAKAYWGQTSEPLVSYPDSKAILEGFKNLEFMVNVDLFITPTGEMCDILLPAAHQNEVDRIENAHSGHGWPASHTFHIRQPFVPPLGEARDDVDIIFDLANRLGVDMGFKDKYAYMNYMLEPLGWDFETFRKKVYHTTPEYLRRYESGRLRHDQRPGFETYTGKVNIYSEDLKKYGWGPLPIFLEGPETPRSKPEDAIKYPYQLISGARSDAFFHSEYRQSPYMRQIHPFPRVQMHPRTAAKEGIADGDWVWIESKYGKCRQMAQVSVLIPEYLIHADHDWWFPEKSVEGLHGAFDSNINTTNHNNGPTDPAIGTDAYNVLCRIYVAREGAPEGIWSGKELNGFLPAAEEL